MIYCDPLNDEELEDSEVLDWMAIILRLRRYYKELHFSTVKYALADLIGDCSHIESFKRLDQDPDVLSGMKSGMIIISHCI